MYVDVSYLLCIRLCISLQLLHECVKSNIKNHYILLLFQICQVEIYCMVLGIGLPNVIKIVLKVKCNIIYGIQCKACHYTYIEHAIYIYIYI